MPYIKMFAASLKSECTQSCKCRCVLPVCWAYRPVCREHGMLRHQAFKHWCLLPLALENLSSSQQPSVQCSLYACYSWAGIQTVLGLRHFGENCLCNLAVNMSLCASPPRTALTEHRLFSSLHTSSSCWQGKA